LPSKVTGTAVSKERWIKGFEFFLPLKFLSTIGYHPNSYIIEDLSHSPVTPRNIIWVLYLDWDLIGTLVLWVNSHFEDSH
jgi:hypothetical protein